jgi:IclR family mhp operon transcriptional activator
MPDKKLVQSFDRGLEVLMFLNRHNGSSIAQIVEGTGINRGIVYRLLETLREKQCVRKETESPNYWLTQTVRCLSDGFRNEAWIDKIAKPEIQRLSQELVWPVSLCTLSGSSMQVRVTSDYVSPLVFDRFPTGFRIPVEGSASAYAYLAFCSDQERNTVLAVVRSIEEPSETGFIKDDAAMTERLKRVREDGYALINVQQKVNALAVPVYSGEMVLGALTLRYFSTAMTPAKAVERFLGPLTRTAEQIANSVRESYYIQKQL